MILAALAWPGPVAGQGLDGTLKKIKASNTLTLGYRESAPPFSFPGPDRRPVGYSVDLCKHIASAVQKQLGLKDMKLNWVPVTAENRIDLVVQGKIDLECGTTTATLARQERVDFSLMTFVDGGSLLTNADLDLRGVGDLAGKRIAVIPGTTTEAALAIVLRPFGLSYEVAVPLMIIIDPLADMVRTMLNVALNCTIPTLAGGAAAAPPMPLTQEPVL